MVNFNFHQRYPDARSNECLLKVLLFINPITIEKAF